MVEFAAELFRGSELELGQRFLAGAHILIGKLKKVDDPEVDLSTADPPS